MTVCIVLPQCTNVLNKSRMHLEHLRQDKMESVLIFVNVSITCNSQISLPSTSRLATAHPCLMARVLIHNQPKILPGFSLHKTHGASRNVIVYAPVSFMRRNGTTLYVCTVKFAPTLLCADPTQLICPSHHGRDDWSHRRQLACEFPVTNKNESFMYAAERAQKIKTTPPPDCSQQEHV